MHPLSNKVFGVNGIAVNFYNGTEVTAGYIVRQTGSSIFWVTDGEVDPVKVRLAPTADIAADLASNPGYCSITVNPPAPDASGATFNLHYGIDHATVVDGGSNFSVGELLLLPNGSVNVATVSGSTIATVTINDPGELTDALATNPQTGGRLGFAATFTPHYKVDTATKVAGGSGYTPSDSLTVTGGGGAKIIVDTVDGGGAIVTAHADPSNLGDLTALPSNPRAVTGGTGSNATFNLQYKLLSVASSGGSNYNVGDTLIFHGMTATVMPTAHISVATSHAATTVVVDTAGSGITVAPSSVSASVNGATFDLTYNVFAIDASGGTGYSVGDPLVFNGMTATAVPQAHVSAVGMVTDATAVEVDSPGSGISAVPTSFGSEEVTTVQRIWSKRLRTVDGKTVHWSLGESIDGSLIVPVFGP